MLNTGNPLIIAHRGASSYAFENTLDSFRKACTFGADMIELDIRVTKDSELIVFHDSAIDRMTDGSGLVQYFTLADLKKIKIHGEAIPTLEEVIKITLGKTNYNFEVKNIPLECIDKLIILLDKYDLRYKVIISSFNRKIILRIKEIDRQIKIALLCWQLRKNNLKFIQKNELSYVHPYYGFLTRKKVKQIHNLGIKINTWTVNWSLDLKWVIELGVDGVITNRPDMAKAVLGKMNREKGTILKNTKF